MKYILASLSVLSMLAVAPAFAEEPVVEISIKEHKFDPAEIKVPSGQKVKLVIKNLDDTAEEFESHDLKREKIVKGGGQITVFIGPLEPGTYGFFGEFHPETAQGKVIVE